MNIPFDIAGKRMLTLEQAKAEFPDAFVQLEATIGGPYELDPAGHDVFYVNRDGELIIGNKLDDLWDKWDSEKLRWEGL